MKPPHHIGAACIAMVLAACSGAQSGSTANPVPVTPSVPEGQHLPGAHRATAALILVANEGAGTGGTIGNLLKARTETSRRARSSRTGAPYPGH